MDILNEEGRTGLFSFFDFEYFLIYGHIDFNVVIGNIVYSIRKYNPIGCSLKIIIVGYIGIFLTIADAFNFSPDDIISIRINKIKQSLA